MRISDWSSDVCSSDLRLVLCSVTLFPLRVDTELDNWPEQGERNCMWASRGAAAVLVDEPDLAEIMRQANLSREGSPLCLCPHSHRWKSRHDVFFDARRRLPDGLSALTLNTLARAPYP